MEVKKSLEFWETANFSWNFTKSDGESENSQGEAFPDV